MGAAERFTGQSGIGLTEKRLLYEFLACVGHNGKTLSGLCRAGAQQHQQPGKAGVAMLSARHTVLGQVLDCGSPQQPQHKHHCTAAAILTADVVQITRTFLGSHCMKHYYVTRQFDELTGVVLNFLKALKKEDSLPADFRPQLQAAVQVRSGLGLSAELGQWVEGESWLCG